MTKIRLGREVSVATVLVMAMCASAGAQSLPPISIGGGLQSSFVHTDPEDDDGTDAFVLNSIRLYLSGSATDNIKIMFNTDYNGNEVNVLDAVGQFAFSPKANIWFGRFLPPSDRANLYGPYYSHHWAVYSDGVQDGYPFIFQGRANGAMYWGQFGKVKVSGGAFDGTSLNGDDTLLAAGRVQVDFWDPEDGYYLNGTYYGDKNLLAIGAAGQVQGGDKSAYNVDFLMERKVSGRWRLFGRGRVGEVRPAGGLQRELRHRRRRLHARRVSLPADGRRGPVRDARQVRQCAIPRRDHAARSRLRPEDDRDRLQLRHQTVQRACDGVLQGHAF